MVPVIRGFNLIRKKMNHGTYEVAKRIRQNIVISAAESMNYLNWSAEFVASQIRELPEQLKTAEWFSPINPADLTEKEMIELGFTKWSKNDPIYLIPLWCFPFLSENVDCGCIDGKMRIYKKIRNGDPP